MALVFSSWLGSDRFSRIGQACQRVYQAEQERTIQEILARPGVKLNVACAPDDDDAILGWSVTAPGHSPYPLVYYVYTKRDVRSMGIAHALLGPLLLLRVEYTHQPLYHPKDVRPPHGWTFNPYRNFR